MIPLNGKGKYKQGVFIPKNPQKYVGKDRVCMWRSSWELKYFLFCDNNPNVLEWASESVIIPYISPLDGKVHKYYTDGVMAIKETTGIVKYIVEIKPQSQTIAPVASKRKKAKTLLYENQTYIINSKKWEAAEQWCKQHGYKFLILSEKQLGI